MLAVEAVVVELDEGVGPLEVLLLHVPHDLAEPPVAACTQKKKKKKIIENSIETSKKKRKKTVHQFLRSSWRTVERVPPVIGEELVRPAVQGKLGPGDPVRHSPHQGAEGARVFLSDDEKKKIKSE